MEDQEYTSRVPEGRPDEKGEAMTTDCICRERRPERGQQDPDCPVHGDGANVPEDCGNDCFTPDGHREGCRVHCHCYTYDEGPEAAL